MKRFINGLIIFSNCFFPTVILADNIPADLEAGFVKEMTTNFENFFHTKVDQKHMDSFMEEKRLNYYRNLSICKPGVYQYGYIDLFPIFVNATIYGFQNDKCIEESTHTMGVSLPMQQGEESPKMVIKCQFQKDSLSAFEDPNLFAVNEFSLAAKKKISDIIKKQCQATFGGKPMN